MQTSQSTSQPQLASVTNQPLERIVAVVNDEIITASDLNSRVRLAMAAAGLPDTPETMQKISPQVLRGLVDEKLELQDLAKEKIEIPDADIDAQVQHIAEQNHQTMAQLEQFLADHNVAMSTLRAQVKVNLAWAKLTQQKLRPDVEVSDEQIDAILERIKANAGKPEYLASEIFLAVDSPEQEAEVGRVAQRLVEQIAGGANFGAVARQFSQSAGAANGGDLGWVQPEQLPANLASVLERMQPSTLSKPIQTPTGYYILLLRDERKIMGANPADARIELQQLTFPLTPGGGEAERTAQRARAEALLPQLKDCQTMAAKTREMGLKGGNLGMVKVSALPPAVARVMATLPVGQPSPLLGSDTGIFIVMACKREEAAGSLPSRDDIANSLGLEQLDMLQRRLLRDLRRAAFVDVRI